MNTTTGSTPKILLVDDSSAIRAFFVTALNEFNLQVKAVPNPKEALNVIDDFNPDCILSDFEMPEMNGVEFCKVIKAHPKFKDVPFVILSMHEQDKFVLECLGVGADDHLPKRTNPEIIIAKVRVMVELHRHRLNMINQERLKTFQAMLGSLKHEWGNLSAILLPLLEKLQKAAPGVIDEKDKSQLAMLERNLHRVLDVIQFFDGIKQVEFEQYVSTSDALILKKSV